MSVKLASVACPLTYVATLDLLSNIMPGARHKPICETLLADNVFVKPLD